MDVRIGKSESTNVFCVFVGNAPIERPSLVAARHGNTHKKPVDMNTNTNTNTRLSHIVCGEAAGWHHIVALVRTKAKAEKAI